MGRFFLAPSLIAALLLGSMTPGAGAAGTQSPWIANNAVFVTPDNPSTPATHRCPQAAFSIYYNPIRYWNAYYTVTTKETPAPTPDFSTVTSAATKALSGKGKPKSIVAGAPTPTPPPAAVKNATQYLLWASADLTALQERIQSEQTTLLDAVNMQVDNPQHLLALQEAVMNDASSIAKAPAGGVGSDFHLGSNGVEAQPTPSPDTVINFVKSLHTWIISSDFTTVMNDGKAANGGEDLDTTGIAKNVAEQTDVTGTVYQNAYVIDDRFLPVLQAASIASLLKNGETVDQALAASPTPSPSPGADQGSSPDPRYAYIVTTGTTPGYEYNGHSYLYNFGANDAQPLLSTPTNADAKPRAQPKPKPPNPPAGDPPPHSPHQNASLSRNDAAKVVAFSDPVHLTDTGTNGGGTDDTTTRKATNPPNDEAGHQADLTPVLVPAAAVDCPSLLVKTLGIGYAFLPYRSWQLGTTMQSGKTVYEVQRQNDQDGRFAATGLFSYRLFGIGDNLDANFSLGAATMTGSTTYLFGLSAFINRSILVTGGFAGGTVQTLNGYQVGQIVPKGTALTTTTSTQIRPAVFVTFPVGDTKAPADDKKSSPKSTPAPKPKNR